MDEKSIKFIMQGSIRGECKAWGQYHFLSSTQEMRFEFPLSWVLRMSVSSKTILNISYKIMHIFCLKLRVVWDTKLKNTSVNTKLSIMFKLISNIEKNLNAITEYWLKHGTDTRPCFQLSSNKRINVSRRDYLYFSSPSSSAFQRRSFFCEITWANRAQYSESPVSSRSPSDLILNWDDFPPILSKGKQKTGLNACAESVVLD